MSKASSASSPASPLKKSNFALEFKTARTTDPQIELGTSNVDNCMVVLIKKGNAKSLMHISSQMSPGISEAIIHKEIDWINEKGDKSAEMTIDFFVRYSKEYLEMFGRKLSDGPNSKFDKLQSAINSYLRNEKVVKNIYGQYPAITNSSKNKNTNPRFIEQGVLITDESKIKMPDFEKFQEQSGIFEKFCHYPEYEFDMGPYSFVRLEINKIAHVILAVSEENRSLQISLPANKKDFLHSVVYDDEFMPINEMRQYIHAAYYKALSECLEGKKPEDFQNKEAADEQRYELFSQVFEKMNKTLQKEYGEDLAKSIAFVTLAQNVSSFLSTLAINSFNKDGMKEVEELFKPIEDFSPRVGEQIVNPKAKDPNSLG